MVLRLLEQNFSVCKIEDTQNVDLTKPFTFLANTDDEISLVCPSREVPENAIQEERDWVCFKIEGILDFSLIGIISKISAILAENSIGLFVISTFNTDYILVKKENLKKTVCLLENNNYVIK